MKDINYKNILWQQHKRHPENKLAEDNFIKQRNLVANKIQRMKKEYYYKKFTDYKLNPARMWKLINSVSNNKFRKISIPPKLLIGGTLVTDTKEICECFNTFFSSIGAELAQKIPLQYHYNRIFTNSKVDNNDKILTAMAPASVDEVIKIINNLDPNTSSGIDNVNTKSIKCLKKPNCSRTDSMFK